MSRLNDLLIMEHTSRVRRPSSLEDLEQSHSVLCVPSKEGTNNFVQIILEVGQGTIKCKELRIPTSESCLRISLNSLKSLLSLLSVQNTRAHWAAPTAQI